MTTSEHKELFAKVVQQKINDSVNDFVFVCTKIAFGIHTLWAFINKSVANFGLVELIVSCERVIYSSGFLFCISNWSCFSNKHLSE